MMKLASILKALFIVSTVIFTSCKKTDWKENYREKEKSPFGNYIISNEANTLFEGQEITVLKDNFYDYLLLDSDSTKTRNYILLKNAAYKQTAAGTTALLEFVKQGNSAFISLNFFKENFKEQLEFTTNDLDKDIFSTADFKKLKGTFYLKNKDFRDKTYHFERNIRRNYFLQYNKNKTIVLGTTKIDGEEVPNFIKIYHGKGAFYLHTNPVVFTNYYLLNNKVEYVENLLSYLSKDAILWDVHLKTSRYSDADEKKPSIFKFFLKHKTLTWFLVVSLAGLLLFMLFNARRKQRAIPVIAPLKNTTVAFTQTISNLYLSEGDHKNLVDKKIAFFLEKVRSKYLIETSNLSAGFIEKLAAKSGNEIQKTKYLIHTIITLNKKLECSEEELIGLHKMIENFLKK
ncbi:hypothetical protein CW731_02660 [Polaribacter sp. ALD11]|uniref:hypothetical protein n=1 Tax=Polaribacter sp. ALD11 TaxID=2058137 RepID=UPI000C314A8E|nr:hypothetical protein [Polaribacter sp. ALD11]AUC84267.1 hypothetical protein CW731_02660 [Polaribacter sp. ALD11]